MSEWQPAQPRMLWTDFAKCIAGYMQREHFAVSERPLHPGRAVASEAFLISLGKTGGRRAYPGGEQGDRHDRTDQAEPASHSQSRHELPRLFPRFPAEANDGHDREPVLAPCTLNANRAKRAKWRQQMGRGELTRGGQNCGRGALGHPTLT